MSARPHCSCSALGLTPSHEPGSRCFFYPNGLLASGLCPDCRQGSLQNCLENDASCGCLSLAAILAAKLKLTGSRKSSPTKAELVLRSLGFEASSTMAVDRAAALLCKMVTVSGDSPLLVSRVTELYWSTLDPQRSKDFLVALESSPRAPAPVTWTELIAALSGGTSSSTVQAQAASPTGHSQAPPQLGSSAAQADGEASLATLARDMAQLRQTVASLQLVLGHSAGQGSAQAAAGAPNPQAPGPDLQPPGLGLRQPGLGQQPPPPLNLHHPGASGLAAATQVAANAGGAVDPALQQMLAALPGILAAAPPKAHPALIRALLLSPSAPVIGGGQLDAGPALAHPSEHAQMLQIALPQHLVCNPTNGYLFAQTPQGKPISPETQIAKVPKLRGSTSGGFSAVIYKQLPHDNINLTRALSHGVDLWARSIESANQTVAQYTGQIDMALRPILPAVPEDFRQELQAATQWYTTESIYYAWCALAQEVISSVCRRERPPPWSIYAPFLRSVLRERAQAAQPRAPAEPCHKWNAGGCADVCSNRPKRRHVCSKCGDPGHRAKDCTGTGGQ